MEILTHFVNPSSFFVYSGFHQDGFPFSHGENSMLYIGPKAQKWLIWKMKNFCFGFGTALEYKKRFSFVLQVIPYEIDA